MKIAILSRNASLYSTSRLVEAGRKRGHRVRVLDPLRCYMRISHQGFEMHYKGRALSGFDAVIPRIGSSITFYGTAVLRQFEMMGVYTPNSSDAVLRARDKLRSLQLLAREGIDLPRTVFGDYPDDTADLLRMLGEPPHVIKLNEGAQGQGVLLAEKRSASQGMIEAFRGLYANFVVQEFIAEAGGGDLRCFVIGNQVAAAMLRKVISGPTCIGVERPVPWSFRPRKSTSPFAQPGPWGLELPAWTCCAPNAGPWSLKSTHRLAWRASNRPPAWMWPARSSPAWKRARRGGPEPERGLLPHWH